MPQLPRSQPLPVPPPVAAAASIFKTRIPALMPVLLPWDPLAWHFTTRRPWRPAVTRNELLQHMHHVSPSPTSLLAASTGRGRGSWRCIDEHVDELNIHWLHRATLRSPCGQRKQCVAAWPASAAHNASFARCRLVSVLVLVCICCVISSVYLMVVASLGAPRLLLLHAVAACAALIRLPINVVTYISCTHADTFS